MRRDQVPWRWSLLTAVLVTYGPFVVMTLYTLAFVRCGHCKETYAWLLPVGPGFITALFSLGWLDSITGLVPRTEWLEWTVAGMNSLATVLFIAAMGRLGQSWLVGAAVAAVFIFAGQAVFLLAAIQA